MRIVHSSDWHAGRIWKGLNRLDELAEALTTMVEHIRHERIDLFVHTGDVFDSFSPSPRAEQLVFDVLRQIHDAGTKTVLIAGNHDSPRRIDAWGRLGELAGVYTIGTPRGPKHGGVVELEIGTQSALIAALPFVPMRMMLKSTDIFDEEHVPHQSYAAGMTSAIRSLSSAFRADAVNLLMLHAHLDGAVLAENGGSERKAQLGEQWTVSSQSLPTAAHYIAVGHIHRPQRLRAGVPAHYAGSPLQMDFGEVGEEKSFVDVEAVVGRPAQVETVPYRGGKELVVVEGRIDELTARSEALSAAGHLRVEVRTESFDADISNRIRTILPNAVTIRQIVDGDDEDDEPTFVDDDAKPVEAYRLYHQDRYGSVPADDLIRRFEELYEEVNGDVDNAGVTTS